MINQLHFSHLKSYAVISFCVHLNDIFLFLYAFSFYSSPPFSLSLPLFSCSLSLTHSLVHSHSEPLLFFFLSLHHSPNLSFLSVELPFMHSFPSLCIFMIFFFFLVSLSLLSLGREKELRELNSQLSVYCFYLQLN